MNTHPEFELLDEYVLGMLDASAASRVSDHLRTCGSCRIEYEAIRPVIDVLPHALEPQSPPDALRDRILAAIDAPVTIDAPTMIDAPVTIDPPAMIDAPATIDPPAMRIERRRLRWLPAALAAALLLALGGNIFLAMRLTQRTVIASSTPILAGSPTSHNDAAKDAAIARLTRDLAVARAQANADRRRPKPSAGPVQSDHKLVAALRTGRVYAIDGAVAGEPWHLTIVQPHGGERAQIYSGTPDAPSGKTYRTWVVRGGRTFNAGELPPATPATLEMPVALRTGDVVAFSLERIGAGARPTTPFLMQLKITQ